MRRGAKAASVAPALPPRPRPPAELRFPSALGAFTPDLALAAFVRQHFLTPAALFYDPDFQHLARAKIGFVWTNARDSKGGRVTSGMAELVRVPPKPQWKEAARLDQIHTWFGGLVDFVVTLHGPFSARANDAAFYALVDHELSHCDQARGAWGARLWNKRTGKPKWAIRGHDVEQHVGTVRRWGIDATGTRALVEAALEVPRFAHLVGIPNEPITCSCQKAA